MTKAPERIWIHPTKKQPLPAKDKHLAKWLRGKWKDHDGSAAGDVEYVRADTIPALLAAEREKTLREAADLRYEISETIGARLGSSIYSAICEYRNAILAMIDTPDT